MGRRGRLVLLSAALVGTVLLVGACGDDDASSDPTDTTEAEASADANEVFSLTSTAFTDGEPIPEELACAGPNPALAWDGVPDGTVELALVVDDPDAPGSTFVHWVVWGIDPDGAIADGEVPSGAVEGTNDADRVGWVGPCPPPGDGPHRYQFTLFALSEEPTVAPAATADELRDDIDGAIVAEARLVGIYERD